MFGVIGTSIFMNFITALAVPPPKVNKFEALLLRLDEARSIRIYGTLMFWDPLDEGKRFIDATTNSGEVMQSFASWMRSVSWKEINFYEPFASATTVGLEIKFDQKTEVITIFGGCLKVASRIYAEPNDTKRASGLFLRKWLSENRDRFVFIKDK